MRRATLALLLLLLAGPASAGVPLGRYSWGISPFCNVFTFSIEDHAGTYSLTGYDRQCGQIQAPVHGSAHRDALTGNIILEWQTFGDAFLATINPFSLNGVWNSIHGLGGSLIYLGTSTPAEP